MKDVVIHIIGILKPYYRSSIVVAILICLYDKYRSQSGNHTATMTHGICLKINCRRNINHIKFCIKFLIHYYTLALQWNEAVQKVFADKGAKNLNITCNKKTCKHFKTKVSLKKKLLI